MSAAGWEKMGNSQHQIYGFVAKERETGELSTSCLDIGDLERREPASGVKFHPGAAEYRQLEIAW